MLANLHSFILVGLLALAFGFIVGNTRQLNAWKVGIFAVLVLSFADQFGDSRSVVLLMIIAFLIGFLLPHAHMLEGFGRSVSNAVNALRYRSEREALKRREEELETLRQQYEFERDWNRRKQAEEAWRKRRESSRRGRADDDQQGGNADSNSDSKQRYSDAGSNGSHYRRTGHEENYSAGTASQNPLRDEYLRELELVPGQQFTKAELKEAYRRSAAKYHPDKHVGKPPAFIAAMEAKFVNIKVAYEWLDAREAD